MNNIQSVAMVFIYLVKFNLLINYIIKINNNNNVLYETLYIYIYCFEETKSILKVSILFVL